MDYIRTEQNGQLRIEFSTDYLKIPSLLFGFHNTDTYDEKTVSGRIAYCHHGFIDIPDDERICKCGCKMHINNSPDIILRHLPIGGNLSCLVFPHNQFRCPKCGATKQQYISFKAPGHRITDALYEYTRDLLAIGTYTNKQVAEITGLGKNVVKNIDKQRLQEMYTINGKELIKPEKPAKYLGIDEFKLHNGYKYASHIIDMETGHILWIANGKKKQVVYDFIAHVGLAWMDNVEAVACDMNSDFEEAFEELCPHIQPVFDYFHIVKNYNDKVVSEVRKDEQRRLISEGNFEAAKSLKKTRYIDLVKEKLSEAYTQTDEDRMAEKIIDIMDICEASCNKHLLWFRKLIDTHFEGIIAHATYKLSAGKIEGINQKIKTLRRHGYGYPDDEYFFLKLFDMSRQDYVRNPKSHRICD